MNPENEAPHDLTEPDRSSELDRRIRRAKAALFGAGVWLSIGLGNITRGVIKRDPSWVFIGLMGLLVSFLWWRAGSRALEPGVLAIYQYPRNPHAGID